MGTEPLCDGVDVVVPLVGEVLDVVVVDEFAVVVVDVGDVVDVDVAPDAIAKPQPRAGSFSVRGSETGDWDSVGAGIDVVVVVESVVVPVVPDEPAVVVVVDELVVVGAAALFFKNSRSEPTSSSARSTTHRTIRKSQRCWGREFRESRISLHRNSGARQCHKRNRNVTFFRRDVVTGVPHQRDRSHKVRCARSFCVHLQCSFRC
jgi:hypothetical protein